MNIFAESRCLVHPVLTLLDGFVSMLLCVLKHILLTLKLNAILIIVVSYLSVLSFHLLNLLILFFQLHAQLLIFFNVIVFFVAQVLSVFLLGFHHVLLHSLHSFSKLLVAVLFVRECLFSLLLHGNKSADHRLVSLTSSL